MSIDSQSHPDYGFVFGLLAGTIVGAGMMMLFTPTKGADLRRRMGTAVDDLAEQGRGLRDRFADRVATTAHDVEQFAAAAVGADSR